MSLVKFSLMFAMYAQLQHGAPVELPQPELPPVQDRGRASWYGDGRFHGDITASGEPFRPKEAPTCAHRTLPFGMVVLLEHPRSHRRVWCRINDRGPYAYDNLETGGWGIRVSSSEDVAWRGVLDMSLRAAEILGTTEVGIRTIRIRYFKKRRRPRRIFDLASWAK